MKSPRRTASPGVLSRVLIGVVLSLSLGCASTESRIAGHRAEARRHLSRGALIPALSEYQEVIRLDPSDPNAHSVAGTLYHRLDDKENAIREFKEAIRLNPALLNPKNSLATIYMEQENFAEAERLYLELSRDVMEEGVFILLGQAAALQGKHEVALRYLERGLGHFGGSVRLAKEVALAAEEIDRSTAILAWDRVAQIAHPFPDLYDHLREGLSSAFSNLPRLNPETMAAIIDAAREAARTGKATLAEAPAAIASSPVGVSFYRPGERPAVGYGEGKAFAENLAAAAKEAAGTLKPGPEPVVLVDVLCGGWIETRVDWDHRSVADKPVLIDVNPRGPFVMGAFGVRMNWEGAQAIALPSEMVAKGWESFYEIYRELRGRLGAPVGREREIKTSRFYVVSFASSGPGGAPVRLMRMNLVDLSLDPEGLDEACRDGADWLVDALKEDGSFRYVYNAVTDRTESGYSLARHAGAALALFRIGDATGEERYRVAGGRALDYLLAQVADLPARGGSALEGGRVGPTSLALLAAIEGKADPKILRGMGRFLIESQRDQGAFDRVSLEGGGPRRSRWAQGQAVYALVELHKVFGDGSYLEAAVRGADYIVDRREAREGFVLDHWFIQAVEVLDPIHHDPRFVTHAYRIADTLASYIARPDNTAYPDWVGGFSSWGQEPKGAAGLGSFEAILSAYRLSLRRGEPRKPLRDASELSARFGLRLQYREENSFYLPSPPRAIGGFRQGLTSPRIRIDGVQHAALALLGLRSIILEEAREQP